MDKDLLIQQLMRTFLDELDEHVRAFNRDLLALEHEPPAAERGELLVELFRTVHSLKGASRAVNVKTIENACHHLEDVLTQVRQGATPIDQEMFTLFFATADALEETAMRLREEPTLVHSPLAELMPKLEAAARLPSAARVRTEHSANTPAQDRAIATGADRPPPPTTLPSSGVEAAAEATGAGAIRIPADKLDAFLAQSGELLVARSRVQEDVRNLVALREHVANWRMQCRIVDQALEHRNPAKTTASGIPGSGAPRQNGRHMHDSLRLSRRAAAALYGIGHKLDAFAKGLDRLAASMTSDSHTLDRAAESLDYEVRRIRMLPFQHACQGLDRLIRDLSKESGKDVELTIGGSAVGLDRSILQGLIDPLRHLVRNAVDHGIESVAERIEAAKPPRGRITVAALLRGDRVEVIVTDDGRGLDLPALREHVEKRGLALPDDDRGLMQCAFLPGVSTAKLITGVSGRGIGLDVVKSRIESLRGTVDIASTPSQGTRFVLTVPLTLTTLRVLLVQAGGQTFAIPGLNVVRLARISPADVRSIEGRQMLALGGAPIPVASLSDALGLRHGQPPEAADKLSVAVLAASERRMAFVVDSFLAEQEVVVKNLGKRLRRVPLFSGATNLPSGDIALVLNAATLIARAHGRRNAELLTGGRTKAIAQRRPRILIAEDSVTTRALEKSILEAAGFDVAVAADGEAAWNMLQEQETDVLVSDIEMPRMDGFALTLAVRQSSRLRRLPVVLVTARETESDRIRGMSVGANAYLVKSAFDQRDLIETIGQLL